ncbi:MAG TPA: carboxypeptidase-like regulatory domain-containing protein [Bacilli bacterium]|nr:carboxypeptidase-like regulatory domain-containing protein [Bacilli bacterium]
MKRKSYSLFAFAGLALLLGACQSSLTPSSSSETPSISSETPSSTSVTTSSETPTSSSSSTSVSSSEIPSSSEVVITDFVISGTVLGPEAAPIENAIVTLGNDASQATFTDASGAYAFDAIELPDPMSVKVSHPDFFGEELEVAAADATGAAIDASFTLEAATYIDLGPDTTFGGKFGLNASYEVAYGEHALAVRNVAAGSSEWADNHKVEIYIDTGTATAGRDNTTFLVQPWAKLSYEDDAINYYAEGRPALEDTFGFVKYFDADVFHVTVPYALLAVESNPVPVEGDAFGFSIGIWNQTAVDWDGWGWWSSPATDAQIAYNVEYGTNFIAPEQSRRYVRLLGDGTITFTKSDGEIWVYVPPVESNLEDLDLTTLTYHSFNSTFGGGQVPGGVTPHVSRTSDLALAVKFTTTQPSWDAYTIEFFLDTGSATAGRTDGTTWRFNVFGNGNVATITSFGGTAFSNAETKTTVDGTNLYFAVSYEALAIASTDQFGVTFGALASGWDGWGLSGVPFVAAYEAEKGGGFVAPEIPHKYIRVLSNGALTWTLNDGSFVSRDTLTGGYRVLESNFGGKFFSGGISFKARHGATGIEFVFTAPVNFETHHKIELFIDTGWANAGQDASTRRIDIWANSDVIAGVEKNVDGAVISVNVLYTTLDISATDQIGFSVGIWNQSAVDWDGWGYGGAPFATAYETAYGNTFIAPEHANRYIRLLSDDSLTFTLANFSFYHA